MADGITAIALNTASGGANLGVDQVTVLAVATDYQIIKIGYADAGTAPVQIGPSNPLPVSVTGTAAVSNFPAKQAVSVAGADGTVNIVGTVPVSLSAANGTANVILTGANGTVNVVGTVPVVNVTSTFTLGTVALAGTPGVAVTGANGTFNIVTLAAGTATVLIAGTLGTVNINNKVSVSLAAADGTVNIQGTPSVIVTGANGTVNIVGTVPVLLAAGGTFTLGTVALAGTPGVAVTGANGTFNIVTLAAGTATVLIAGTLGTVNINNKVSVSLAAADGTVNIQGNPSVIVTGANGTVNVVGTVPILHAASSTFTLGTVALAGTPGVAVTGANGTFNIVTLAAGTATVVLIGANGTVNIVGSATIAAGNAPASGLVALSVYNTAAPAPTSGQSMALQSDYAGNLFVVKRRSQSKSAALSIAGGGTATLLAAQAAGIFADLAGIVISISNVAVAGIYQLALTDGTTTYQYNMGMTAAGGTGIMPPIVAIFDPPLLAGGAAAPWTIRGLNTLGTANIIANFVLQKQA